MASTVSCLAPTYIVQGVAGKDGKLVSPFFSHRSLSLKTNTNVILRNHLICVRYGGSVTKPMVVRGATQIDAGPSTLDKQIVPDSEFSISKISLGVVGLALGCTLLSYGFGAYFTFLPGAEWSALMLTYGFPLALIGMALKALEEVDKNLLAMRQMLLGDGETEPNSEQISQLALEACKEDLLELLVQKLPIVGWEARKDLVHIWCTLLRQKVGSSSCCLEYIENHTELLDFLVSCYENKDTALNCGNMLRECAKYPSLAKYLLESASFELFFKYVELPNFDIASDAFTTFKELLTKHETVVSEYLTANYTQFFGLYEKFLTSANYVTRRQSLKLLSEFLLERPNAAIMVQYISEVPNLKMMMTLLKDPSKNIQSSAFHIFKVFVANPNKPPSIISLLLKNRDKLLKYLENLRFSKEDEQFEEEKDLLVREIEGLRLPGDGNLIYS